MCLLSLCEVFDLKHLSSPVLYFTMAGRSGPACGRWGTGRGPLGGGGRGASLLTGWCRAGKGPRMSVNVGSSCRAKDTDLCLTVCFTCAPGV